MSKASLPPVPRPIGPRATIEIVASEFNRGHVESLLSAATTELDQILPASEVRVHWVPGAYEIPVCVAALLEQSRPSAVIALGVIIRGETAHADLIAGPIFTSLQNLAVSHKIPVINEVLLVDSEEQATARAARGIDAARAAAKMFQLLQDLPSNG